MPLSRTEVDEVKRVAREELRHDLENLSQASRSNAEANANIAKAIERLSMIITGDQTLGIVGLVSDLKVLKDERQQQMITQAKRAGIWLGGSTVAVGVARMLWELAGLAFSK